MRIAKAIVLIGIIFGIIVGVYLAVSEKPLTFKPRAVGGPPTFSFESDVPLQTGRDFTLMVYADTKDTPFHAFELHFTYDSEKIALQDQTVPSSNVSSDYLVPGLSKIDPASGTISIIGAKLNTQEDQTAIVGNRVRLASVRMSVKDTVKKGDTVVFNWSDVKKTVAAEAAKIDVDAQPATFTVAEPGVSTIAPGEGGALITPGAGGAIPTIAPGEGGTISTVTPAGGGIVSTVTPAGGGVISTVTPSVTPIAGGVISTTLTPTQGPGGVGIITPTSGQKGVGITLNMMLKFQGIVKKPVNAAQIPVKVTIAGPEGAGRRFTEQVLFTIADERVYFRGTVTFADAPEAKDYKIYIKGPRHLQKKICHATPVETYPLSYRCSGGEGVIALVAGENTLDFTQIYQLVGDLPDQDGFVNSYDLSLVRNNIVSSDPQALEFADLNLDGTVNTQDYSLVIAALEFRTDEE